MSEEDVMAMITLKESMMKQILEYRIAIADLKEEKINKRAEAWIDAEGIADAKKDYVRSQVSELDKDINVCEAQIEHYYNQIRILDEKIELEYLKDE